MSFITTCTKFTKFCLAVSEELLWQRIPFLYFICRSILCILPVVFTFWSPLCFWPVDPTFVFYLRFLSCILNVHTSFVFYLYISHLYFRGRPFLCIFICSFMILPVNFSFNYSSSTLTICIVTQTENYKMKEKVSKIKYPTPKIWIRNSNIYAHLYSICMSLITTVSQHSVDQFQRRNVLTNCFSSI